MGQQNVLSVFFHFSLFYWVEVFTLCKETKKGGKRHRVGHSIALYKIRKGQTPFFFAVGQSAPCMLPCSPELFPVRTLS